MTEIALFAAVLTFSTAVVAALSHFLDPES
jgi:hypothetical protein